MTQKNIEHIAHGLRELGLKMAEHKLKQDTEEGKHSLGTGITLCIVGVFLVPFGLGIIILPWGVWKTYKALFG